MMNFDGVLDGRRPNKSRFGRHDEVGKGITTACSNSRGFSAELMKDKSAVVYRRAWRMIRSPRRRCCLPLATHVKSRHMEGYHKIVNVTSFAPHFATTLGEACCEGKSEAGSVKP